MEAAFQVPFGPLEKRDEAISAIQTLLKGNETAKQEDKMLIYRMAYLPQDGMFKLMPNDLELGTYKHEDACQEGLFNDSDISFVWGAQKYSVGDFVYLNPRYD